MLSGIVLLHIVVIPLVFMLGRLSNRVAMVRVSARDRSSVPEFLRKRD
ncbi:MAG: hypothetical protein ACXVC1_08720 [Tumebacillaceae bacterium]